MEWNLVKEENEDKHIWQLFSVTVILQILDIVFSHIAFSMGSIEINPIMIFFMSALGPITGMIVLKVLILIPLYLLFKYGKKRLSYKFKRNSLYVVILPYIALTSYHIMNILLGKGII